MIIILTKVMKMIDWEAKARTIPNPENYFQGRTVADGFRLPASILIFFHDYPHEKTIISTRYMLIFADDSHGMPSGGLRDSVDAGGRHCWCIHSSNGARPRKTLIAIG